MPPAGSPQTPRYSWPVVSSRWLWPVVLAVAGVLLITRPWAEDPTGAAPTESTHPVSEAEALYERAIGDLESALRATEAPDGMTSLEEAIAPERLALDAAIEESRRRAAESPDNEQAQETLIESLRRKLDLLHNTLMLTRDMERGDSATARDRIEAISGRDPPDTN